MSLFLPARHLSRLIFRFNGVFLSIMTGVLLFVAFPGGGEFWPLVFVALVPVIHGSSKGLLRNSFMAGLSCGLVHYSLLLYWLVTVLAKYGGLPLYFAIPAFLLLVFYMSLYFGLFTVVAAFLSRSLPAHVLLFLLPALWVGIDWFRAVFLTGFPWMDLGYSLYATPQLIQIADILGHHGLTYLIVFVNYLLFLLVNRKKSAAAYLSLLLPGIVVLAGYGYYSHTRYQTIEGEIQAQLPKGVGIGIVQGNMDQAVKWTASKQRETVDTYIGLTKSLESEYPLQFVVWPETAMPFYPSASTETLTLIDFATSSGLAILTGSPWYEMIDVEARKMKFYNSAFLLQSDGKIGGSYYKSHLVPFGEYVPLKQFLPFLAPLVEAVGDFSPGTIEKPIGHQRVRAGVLICFESVFPELSRSWVKADANLLVNLTNDAWYGKSSAPYHSLAMTVLRAVETRRAVVRSANTGISAFIAPDGRITKQSEIFVPWAAASTVVLLENRTFWVRYGYLFGPVCLLFGLCGTLFVYFRQRWV